MSWLFVRGRGCGSSSLAASGLAFNGATTFVYASLPFPLLLDDVSIVPAAWKDVDRGAGAPDFRRRDGRLVNEPWADRVFPMNFDLKFGSTRGFSAPGFSLPDFLEASSSFSSPSSSSVDSRLSLVSPEGPLVLTPASSSDSSEDSSLECGSCDTGFLSLEGCALTARDRFSVGASWSFLDVFFDSVIGSFGLRAIFR